MPCFERLWYCLIRGFTKQTCPFQLRLSSIRSAVQKPKTPPHKGRVLVVDGQVSNRRLIRHILEDDGYSVS